MKCEYKFECNDSNMLSLFKDRPECNYVLEEDSKNTVSSYFCPAPSICPIGMKCAEMMDKQGDCVEINSEASVCRNCPEGFTRPEIYGDGICFLCPSDACQCPIELNTKIFENGVMTCASATGALENCLEASSATTCTLTTATVDLREIDQDDNDCKGTQYDKSDVPVCTCKSADGAKYLSPDTYRCEPKGSLGCSTVSNSWIYNE
jgi:hypothetical protein